MGHHVINVNGIVWNVLSTANWMIKRGKTVARLVWSTATTGKMIYRDKRTGRFCSRAFTAV